MKERKVRGIVISEMPVGEKDKRLIIFTKEYGKLTLFAKNSRSSKSKLMSCSQLFSYSDMIVVFNRNYINLKQGDLIESFYFISKDINNYYLGIYFLELLDIFSPENESDTKKLKLILKILLNIKKGRLPLKLLKSIFELKLLSLAGYRYITNFCVVCKSKEEYYKSFSIERGGVVCNRCFAKNSIEISKGTLKAMDYILSSKVDQLFSFSLREDLIDELEILTERMILYYSEKKIKSLEMLKVYCI